VRSHEDCHQSIEDESREEMAPTHDDEVKSPNEHDLNEAEHGDGRLLEDHEEGREKDGQSRLHGTDEDYYPEDDGSAVG
jgi:hypothetical protein